MSKRTQNGNKPRRFAAKIQVWCPLPDSAPEVYVHKVEANRGASYQVDTQREPPNLRPGAFTPFVQGPMSDSLFTGMNPATMAMPNPYQDQYAPSAYMNGPGYQTDYSAFGPPDQNLLLFSVNNGLGPANSSSSQVR